MRYFCACVVTLVVIATATSTIELNAQVVRSKGVEYDYFAIKVAELTAAFDPSQVISEEPIPNGAWYQMDTGFRVVVPSGCEAYYERPAADLAGDCIVGIKPKGQPIDGDFYRLERTREDNQKSALVRSKFTVLPQPITTCTKEAFLLAKGRYYERLWSEQHAGSAIWRHLAVKSLGEVGLQAKNTGPSWPLRPNDGTDDTIQLMSGGRAVSENLQLDRQLPITDSEAERGARVDLATVSGITIAEVNWLERIGGAKVELDPLAKFVPHDQYALFAPSFAALVQLIESGTGFAKPLVQWLEPQSRGTDSVAFYQKQLGLPLSFASRQVAGAFIDEIAVTGSDPYFRTGTDVAVLMKTTQADVFHETILAQIALSAREFPDARRSEEELEGRSLISWRTVDRKYCSYVAKLPDAVVVSNSLHQMRQILSAATGKQKSLHEAGEYQFFRQRYPREAKDNKSLLVVTDAAIRRWCGPHWRIGASRRTRARAGIAELTVQHLDALAANEQIEARPITSNTPIPEIGLTHLGQRGVRSELFGTLDFQTPIAELNIHDASRQEVTLYETWRNAYQQRWRNTFDPIALQVAIKEQSISVDLSVIPLILGSSYRWILEVIGITRLKADLTPKHKEVLIASATALDANSQPLNFVRGIINGPGNVNVLGWIDEAIVWHVEFDQEWMDRQSGQSPWGFNQDQMLTDLPLGVFFPSRDNLRMAAFVVALRATIERLAPNILTWEESEHAGKRFAIGTFASSTPLGDGKLLPRIYYATLPDGFVASTNVRVMKRMIEHHSAPASAAAKPIEVEPLVGEAMLKPQQTLWLTGKGANVEATRGWTDGMRRMRRIAWSNIPALNYLRHKYPDQDPIGLYERVFGEAIFEPAGGRYEWNEKRQTFESSNYGHHLAPRAGPAASIPLSPTDIVAAALSFQDGGIRAQLKLDRKR